MTHHVVIVGAGVIGLTSAWLLCESGFDVTIVAEHFPNDGLNPQYTSPWAGAHFRPFPSKSESDKKEVELNRRTLSFFKQLSKENPESSVKFVKGIEYFEAPDDYYSSISSGYSEGIDNFKVLEKSELPNGCVLGTEYDAWVVNSPHYIRFLQQKLMFKYGVKFVRTKLESLKQVQGQFPKSIIVNASGMGLQYSGDYDPQCFPIRGQTLLVRAPQTCSYFNKTITHQSKDGLWTFVIPRPLDGGIILGGTKQPNDLLSTPRDADTQSLIERGKKLYPELVINGELDIRGVNVGFRPARNGGSRVELERFGKCNVVHAYGAGGMGYELSYGMAEKVLEIVKGVESLHSKL